MIAKYQRERELKSRKDEDRKAKVKKRATEAMCNELAKQQEERKKKLKDEKADRDQ